MMVCAEDTAKCSQWWPRDPQGFGITPERWYSARRLIEVQRDLIDSDWDRTQALMAEVKELERQIAHLVRGRR